MRTAIRELGLSERVRVRPMRGEALAQAEPVSFDVALSRATFSPAQWLAFARQLVRPGGRIFALAAPDAVPKGTVATLYLGGRRALVEVVVPVERAGNVPRGTSLEAPAPDPNEPPPGSSVRVEHRAAEGPRYKNRRAFLRLDAGRRARGPGGLGPPPYLHPIQRRLSGSSHPRRCHSGPPPVLRLQRLPGVGRAIRPWLRRPPKPLPARGLGLPLSRLITGGLPAHRRLEAGLAAFVGRPSTLLFPTGYQTNVGVVTALAGPADLIVSDALNHASLIDGCRLSRARTAVYPHGDARAARRLLRAGRRGFRRRILVTESLFSMDGDLAPLAALAEAAADTDAILIVDEAHALGVLGPGGRGLSASLGVVPDVLVGTLGKAFGAAGGFAAGPPSLREVLVNRARTFIYTTALPPPIAAAAAAALNLMQGPEGEVRRRALDGHRLAFAEGLNGLGLQTEATAWPHRAGGARVRGPGPRRLLYAPSSRTLRPRNSPADCPPGTARLRVTLSAAHTPEDVRQLTAGLAEALRDAS